MDAQAYRYEHYDPLPSKVPDVTGVPLAGLADVPGAKFGSAI